jgi:formate dehydrogenase maturation protein FdhE
MPRVSGQRPHSPRAESREVTELKRLKALRPELAEAADLHLALLDVQRRVQARAAVPWMDVAPERVRRAQDEGSPLLRFKDLPLDWTEFRLVFRQTADVLRRFDALEPDDHRAIEAVSRDGNALDPFVVRWFDATAAPGAAGTAPEPKAPVSLDAMDQVLALAMRPFLERCADVIQQRIDFTAWRRGFCPLCGGEPEFAVLTSSGDRMLICGRCTARWRFGDAVCPFCGNDDRTALPSFSSPDGLYRLYACDACRRYLKAYDARQGGRPVMLALDSVATLPLDAAAVGRGYRS